MIQTNEYYRFYRKNKKTDNVDLEILPISFSKFNFSFYV